MADGVKALGSGFWIGWCHSSQKGQRIMSELAVGRHDERVEVRVLVVLPSFILLPSECGVFACRWLVKVDGFGGEG